jgi:hypothetical protein
MILAAGYWHGEEYIPEIVDDPCERPIFVASSRGYHAFVKPLRRNA